MFSKTTSPQTPQPPRRVEAPSAPFTAQADASRRAAPKAASLLASDLVFEGAISGDGELHIDGTVKGDIHVARLIIGERALVEGTVRSAQVEVRGRVNGNIEGKSVRLLETAHVEGDITHEQLSIDVGAFFQGRCAQYRPAAPAVQTLPLHPVEPAYAEVTELDHAERL